jgi:hypothetical protein
MLRDFRVSMPNIAVATAQSGLSSLECRFPKSQKVDPNRYRPTQTNALCFFAGSRALNGERSVSERGTQKIDLQANKSG